MYDLSAEQSLERRARQLASVAALGHDALAGQPLDELFDEAVAQLSQVLDCGFTKILKYRPEQNNLLLVAGVGWKKGLVGAATVADECGSQAGYTLASNKPVIVADLEKEKRFQGPELLLSHGVKAGLSTIIGPGNAPWGVLGAHCDEKRKFSEDDVHFLQAVARILFDAISRKENEHKLHESQLKLQMALQAAQLGVWDYDPVSGRSLWDGRQYELFGRDPGLPAPDMDEFMALIHPDDRGRVGQAIDDCLKGEHAYQVEYRIGLPQAEDLRWIGAFGNIAMADGKRRMMGVNFDISERKRPEHRNEIVARELDHRVKNIMTTVSAMARLTAQRVGSVEEFTDAFSSRLQSMTATHSKLAAGKWQGVGLSEILDFELASYVDAVGERISLAGAPVMLGPGAAQCLSMAIHELSTNAVKYGALSDGKGAVEISWSMDQRQLTIVWRESGGPPVKQPARSGFGLTAIKQLVEAQLNATVSMDFKRTGLVCELVVPLDETAPEIEFSKLDEWHQPLQPAV